MTTLDHLEEIARAATPKAGAVYRVPYPFVKIEIDVPDGENGSGFATINSWKPGVEFVACGPIGDDSEALCDGIGAMILTVVDTFKPGRFPARVFYTRRWVSPEGKEFGKGALHVTTVPAFKRRAKSYMHEYTLRAALAALSSPVEAGE